MPAPWEKYQGQSGPWAKYGGGPTAPQPQVQKAPLGQSPFRGGVRGELTLAGKAKPWTAEDTARMNRGIDDFGRGVAVGVPSSVVGMPGDIESLGRLALSPLGVSTDSALPTSSEIGNAIAGPPRSTQEEGGRGVAGFIGLPGAMALARGTGKVAGTLAKGSAPSQVVQDVRASGYVVPPNMAQERPSLISQGLSAWGGKIKTQQAASVKNQQITNAIAAKELGVSPNTPLTKQTFDTIREQAGKAYGAVSQAMPQLSTDLTFASEVRQLGGRASKAAQEFPGLFENSGIEKLVGSLAGTDKVSTQSAMQVVRQLRADASSHIKAFDDPARKALGHAQRDAAAAIEGLIERRLAQGGNATLMNDFRQARQLIAKSHDVEAATNLQTGEVSARDLARMADKGRPLTGGLAAIAKMGGAFPKAAQDASAFGGGEGIGILDAGVGAIAAGAGRPELLGALLARPAARATVLSNPYQNAVLGAGNANVPGAQFITPRLLGLIGAQNAQRLLERRNEPR